MTTSLYSTGRGNTLEILGLGTLTDVSDDMCENDLFSYLLLSCFTTSMVPKKDSVTRNAKSTRRISNGQRYLHHMMCIGW